VLQAAPSAYWDAFTHETLARSGLGPGMRVLDIGCGAGDPSLTAAALVGPGGEVVGVDRDTALVELATLRASGAELANLEFVAAELRTFEPPGQFDALIGRFILRSLPDPVASLRRLTPAVVSGGIVAFIDTDWIAARTTPAVPLVDEILQLIRETMHRSGIALDLGPRLWRILQPIGVRDLDLRIDARAEPAPATAATALLAETVHGLLPMMERFGMARPAELGVDTLATRLQDALRERQATLLPPTVAGVTGRVWR
jgi:SAM-dependent methyltransferase